MNDNQHFKDNLVVVVINQQVSFLMTQCATLTIHEVSFIRLDNKCMISWILAGLWCVKATSAIVILVKLGRRRMNKVQWGKTYYPSAFFLVVDILNVLLFWLQFPWQSEQDDWLGGVCKRRNKSKVTRLNPEPCALKAAGISVTSWSKHLYLTSPLSPLPLPPTSPLFFFNGIPIVDYDIVTCCSSATLGYW